MKRLSNNSHSNIYHKIKRRGLSSLFDISQSKFISYVSSPDIHTIFFSKFQWSNYMFYSPSYLFNFLVYYLRRYFLNKRLSLVFDKTFYHWLESIDFVTLSITEKSELIELLYVLINSRIKNYLCENTNQIFLKICCNICFSTEDMNQSYIIGKKIYESIDNCYSGIIHYQSDIKSLYLKLFSNNNIKHQILAIKFYSAIHRYINDYPDFILEKLTLINKTLQNDLDKFSKDDRKLVFVALYYWHILITDSDVRITKRTWIKENMLIFFQSYKHIFLSQWILNYSYQGTKYNNSYLKKNPFSIIIDILTRSITSLNANEACTSYGLYICDMICFPTYVKLKFGDDQESICNILRHFNDAQNTILTHFTQMSPLIHLQRKFLSSSKQSNIKLIHMFMIFYLYKYPLLNEVIHELIQIYFENLNSDKDFLKVTEIIILLIKSLDVDFILKLKTVGLNDTDIENFNGLLNFLNGSKNAFNDTIDKQVNQIINDSSMNLSGCLSSQYFTQHISVLNHMCHCFFLKCSSLLDKGNMEMNKLCTSAIKMILQTSDFAFLSISESLFTKLCNILNEHTKDDINNEINRKIAAKNCLYIFDLLFRNNYFIIKQSHCIMKFYKSILSIVNDIFILNKMGLRDYFIKNNILQESLLIVICTKLNLPDDEIVQFVMKYFHILNMLVQKYSNICNVDHKKYYEELVKRSLKCIDEKVIITNRNVFNNIFSSKYWTFKNFYIPSAEIYFDKFLKSFEKYYISDFDIVEFFDVYGDFLLSTLNFVRSDISNESININFDRSVGIFVENIHKKYSIFSIENKILSILDNEDRNHIPLWILTVALRKSNMIISDKMKYKLLHYVQNWNKNSNMKNLLVEVIYLILENNSINLKVSYGDNTILNIKGSINSNLYQIIQGYKHFKEELKIHFKKKYESFICLIDKLKDTDDELIIHLPSKYKMTFKVNFKMLALNSYYFEGLLNYSKESKKLFLNLSENEDFYSPSKEIAVKLSLKLIIHLLHGSSLFQCRLLSDIDDKKILASALMMSLYLQDRLLIKDKPKEYLFDFIIYNFYMKSNNTYLHEEIVYTIPHIIKSGCIYLFEVIFEILSNFLKFNDAKDEPIFAIKSIIIIVVNNTLSYQDYYGSEICWNRLISLIL